MHVYPRSLFTQHGTPLLKRKTGTKNLEHGAPSMLPYLVCTSWGYFRLCSSWDKVKCRAKCVGLSVSLKLRVPVHCHTCSSGQRCFCCGFFWGKETQLHTCRFLCNLIPGFVMTWRCAIAASWDMRGSDPKLTADISKGGEGTSHPQIHLASQITVGSEEKIESCLLRKQASVPASTPSPAMTPRVWSSWHSEESWEFADKQPLLSGNSLL